MAVIFHMHKCVSSFTNTSYWDDPYYQAFMFYLGFKCGISVNIDINGGTIYANVIVLHLIHFTRLAVFWRRYIINARIII